MHGNAGGKPQARATDRDIRAILVKHIIEATERANAASRVFNAVIDEVPSGSPHPDGTQRIRNASRDLDSARREMMKAHTRLNEFVERGIVPEDLKQGNGS
jgi:hypothetical protein